MNMLSVLLLFCAATAASSEGQGQDTKLKKQYAEVNRCLLEYIESGHSALIEGANGPRISASLRESLSKHKVEKTQAAERVCARAFCARRVCGVTVSVWRNG